MGLELDNECSKVIKTFIGNENNATLQFVEPHKHRVNAAERSIQTFKNNFVSGLCTVNKLFPMQLWCELLQQAEISINPLRSSRKNPKLSAYALLEGEFNLSKPHYPHQARKHSFSPTRTQERHGRLTQRMCGMWGQPLTITNVSVFGCQKQRHSKLPKRKNSFQHILPSLTSLMTTT